jgi:hypothetical protein
MAKIIGIDFSSAYTQIGYLDDNHEVQSLSMINGEQKYMIPTKLLKYKDRPVWCIGDEAVLRNKQGEGTLVGNLLELLLKEEGLTIDGRDYTSKELLQVYLREICIVIRANLKVKEISHVVVSVAKPNRQLVTALWDAFVQQGIPREQIRIISHTESFLYYVLHQNRELWNNQVVMIHLGEAGCFGTAMKVVNQRGQSFVLTEELDFSQHISMELTKTPEGCIQADKTFLELMRNLFSGRVVSAVYLTGEGFQTSWAKESMRFLCNKRRVFQGTNLIVKGAGLCAKEYFYAAVLGRFLFQCPGLTSVEIGLKTTKQGVENEIALSKAGTHWYESDVYLEGILDRVSYLTFVVRSPVTGIEKVMYLELNDFPKRPHKTTRVGVHIYYADAARIIVEVTDLGFGDFFPASGKKVKETIQVTPDMERRLS